MVSVSSPGADTKTQSRRGPGISPRVHRGVDRMVSRYIPFTPEGLLGAKKVAWAEWNTDMSVTSNRYGHSARGISSMS